MSRDAYGSTGTAGLRLYLMWLRVIPLAMYVPKLKRVGDIWVFLLYDKNFPARWGSLFFVNTDLGNLGNI